MPHLQSQRPDQFGWPLPPRGVYVPFEYAGHRFPSGVAAGTVPIFTRALDRICSQSGFRLPTSTGLDAGMWGQQTRQKTSGNGWSFHAYGLAIDVAAPWNPYGRSRPADSIHRLPLNTQSLVDDLGILWGAAFDDWMHLEIHLSPGEVRSLCDGMSGQSESPVSPVGVPAAFPLPAGSYYGPRSGPATSVSNTYRPRPEWVAGLARFQSKLGVIADGVYGPATAAATRSYQAQNGLSVDGLIGANTWRQMFPQSV